MNASETEPNDELDRLAWETCGVVDLDTSAFVIGDARTFARWRRAAEWHPFSRAPAERLFTYGTGEDAVYPVEKAVRGSRVVAVRVELVDDLAEVAGQWQDREMLTIGTTGCVVIDPCHEPAAGDLRTACTGDRVVFANGYPIGSLVAVPAGRWRVQTFQRIGVRLLSVR